MLERTILVLCGLAGLVLSATVGFAQQSPTADQIIERLKGGGGNAGEGNGRRTRGLSVSPGQVAAPPPGSGIKPITAPGASDAASAPIEPAPLAPVNSDRVTVDQIFLKAPRGLSTGERQKVADIVKAKPGIDLEIYFEFNSSDIGPKAVPALLELGKALSSDALAGTRLLVAGHTDGKGEAAYNQKLSERRAASIRNFLVVQFKVQEARLLSVGFGKEQLKNKADPFAGENRRVQVVNLDSR